MTPLADILCRRIAQTGPISLMEYMAECLMHPEHGYYVTRDPLGAAGDFITAPEVSQMFGELLGLSLAQSWRDQGAPASFTLAELGPGRGTLMADILRATRHVPGFHDALRLHLVETSPALQKTQGAALPAQHITWCDTVQSLPDDQPLWLVANEFFDALPIRQFSRDGSMWRETQVGLAAGALSFGRSSPMPLAQLAHRLDDTTDGQIVEICTAATPICAQIGERIARHGGAAIFIDYGAWHALGDTFQALENHSSVDPLAHPGEADLTAHVDFEALAIAARDAGALPSRMITQRDFLGRLGIGPRAEALAKELSGAALDQHIAAFERLTSPEEMGTLFKALAIAPTAALLPPGFDL